MSLPHYAHQEYALRAVIAPDPDSVDPHRAAERKIAASFSTERKFAQYLDNLDLPVSSVIADTVYGFAVVAASAKPKTFVVPSDPDFVRSTIPPPTGSGICCHSADRSRRFRCAEPAVSNALRNRVGRGDAGVGDPQ